MKTKKLFALLMVLVMILSLAACGGTTEPAGDSDSFEPVVWRFANMHPGESFISDSDRWICDQVKEATEGRVTLELYTDSQLGDYLSVFDEVMLGSIEMAHITPIEKYDSRLTAGYLPYLGSDYASLKKALEKGNFIFETCYEIEKGLGIELMGYFVEGFNGIGTNKEITNPGDPNANKNTLIRVPAMNTYQTANTALGFQTSSIPYSDTYTAIQTGLVDGWSGGAQNVNHQYFRDVIKYFYDYRECMEVNAIHINAEAFASLLPEDQEAIAAIITQACDESFDKAEAEATEYTEVLEAEGIRCISFTDEEYEALANKVREEAWPELAKTYPEGFIDQVLESIK